MTTSLGSLSAFTGTYGGINTSSGMNAIYVPSKNGPVMKIHRIREEFKFLSEQGLFGVPVNRGHAEDITITPIVYDQYVADNDVPETADNLRNGAAVLHQEDGMFLLNPASNSPHEPASVQRLGSLPHGVAFNAQGFITTVPGPPTIPMMNASDAAYPTGMQPFMKDDKGLVKPMPAPMPSATDLAKFPASVLADPNSLLRNVIAKQNITSTTIITTDTDPTYMPGGGVTNSAFLLGNAKCLRQRSTFFIETVSTWLGPVIQIQYTQEVLLQFDGITYPHITVATMTRDPWPTPIVI